MTERSDTKKTEYWPSGPVSLEFIKDDSFIVGIKGPVGSGKSVACVNKIMRNSRVQPVASDGVMHSRYAIIRNTMPELKSTTMKTWHQWVPKNVGHWVGQGPPTHTITQKAVWDGDRLVTPGLNIEVMFVALDTEDDVKKVLSMELTSAWINEAREVPKAILDGLTGRVGRFNPDIDNPATFAAHPQVMMDTNPPDADHWWYYLAERDQSTPFGRQMLQSMMEAEQELQDAGLLDPGQSLYSFHDQPGGTSNLAENIDNLLPGYYTRIKAGKSQQWVSVYVDGNYGFVQDGRPVFPEYNDQIHCQEVKPIPGLKLCIGLDFGWSPAAIFGQRDPSTGQWRIYSEICGEGMNLKTFADAIKAHVSEEYRGLTVGKITGDPYGDRRDPNDAKSRTTFQMLKAYKINAVSSPDKSNGILRRLEAVRQPLIRLVGNGEPGLVIHPQCRILRKGMAGGYRYERKRISGEEAYKDDPKKDHFSDPADALQYLLMGGGEFERILDMGAEPIQADRFEPYTVMDGVM